MAGQLEGQEYDLILIGRKAAGYFRFRHYPIAQSYEGISDKPTYEDARRIAEHITERFISGAVDRVVLVYTEFVSLGIQRPVVRSFLPLQPSEQIAASRPGRPTWPPSSSSPRPEAVLVGAAAPLRRGPPVLGPAGGGRLRARQPPAGHEGGHRQRRGHHHPPQPTAEPGPPGHDHHRDHGDHRRGRGPQAPTRAIAEDLLLSRLDAQHPFPPTRGTWSTDHLSTSESAADRRPVRAPAPRTAEEHRTVTVTEPTTTEGRPDRRHRRARWSTSSSRPTPSPRSTPPSPSTSSSTAQAIEVRAEVAQQIGDSRVRAIALKPTDGLRRGAPVRNLGRRPDHAGGRRHARPRVQRDRRAPRRHRRRAGPRSTLLGDPPPGPGLRHPRAQAG